jgi:hypothetical protein
MVHMSTVYAIIFLHEPALSPSATIQPVNA